MSEVCAQKARNVDVCAKIANHVSEGQCYLINLTPVGLSWPSLAIVGTKLNPIHLFILIYQFFV